MLLFLLLQLCGDETKLDACQWEWGPKPGPPEQLVNGLDPGRMRSNDLRRVHIVRRDETHRMHELPAMTPDDAPGLWAQHRGDPPNHRCGRVPMAFMKDGETQLNNCEMKLRQKMCLCRGANTKHP